ncbi:MAG: hypothetical protein NT083_03855 [Rhodocyclales bacterium]|nr:hypothetical protein [Rhodocyclales bacterium]
MTGQARNASNKRDVTTLRQLSSGSDKPRQLGSLQIKGCRRSTSKPSVFGTDQAISEIGASSMAGSSSLGNIAELARRMPSPKSTDGDVSANEDTSPAVVH